MSAAAGAHADVRYLGVAPCDSSAAPRSRRSVVLGHHHQRRAQQAIVQQPALLVDLHDVAGRVRRRSRPCSWPGAGPGSNGWPAGSTATRPLSPATLSSWRRVSSMPSRRCWAVSPCTAQAGFQAVDHRQQVAEQALVGELARHVDVARQALALVVQFGALAQRFLAQLGQLGLGGLELGGQRGIAFVRRRRSAAVVLGRFGHRADRWSCLARSLRVSAQQGSYGARPDGFQAPALRWVATLRPTDVRAGSPPRAPRRRPAPPGSPGRRPCGSGRSRPSTPSTCPPAAYGAVTSDMPSSGARPVSSPMKMRTPGALHRALEQLQDLALAGERLEQLAQAVQVGQVLHAHQPGLPGQHHVVVAVGVEHLLGQLDRLRQQRLHLGAGAAQLAQQRARGCRPAVRPAKWALR